MQMYALLPKILNMSLTAGVIIVLVLLVRIPLRKAPKIFSYALWVVVLFRLVCPVSFPAEFSLLGVFHAPAAANGSIAYISNEMVNTEYRQAEPSISGAGEAINAELPQDGKQSASVPAEWQMAAATVLWLCGIAAMLVYSAVSLLLMRQRLIGAVRLRGNIYLADHIATPFVIGIFRPKIYLPSSLTEQERGYIILHEQTHIRRLDHISKMIAFLSLAVHWFNPLVWAAFVNFSKDMEMSCDERVLKEMGAEIKGAYSTSLLSLATGRRLINGSPLAFGEGNIKGRIRNVMNFKKPQFWVLISAAAIVTVAALSLLANPPKSSEIPVVSSSGAASGASSNAASSDAASSDASSNSLLSGTAYSPAPAYASDKCLYLTPLSSTYPKDDTGQLYLFDPAGTFTIISKDTKEVQEMISLVDWTGSEVEPNEWDSLFGIGDPVDIGSYSTRKQYKAGHKYFIYQMDEELWLATINDESMWSLYRLKKTSGPDFNSVPAAAEIVPAAPSISLEQEVGVDMTELDYASDKIVIFHDYFGLFVYDLNSKKIVRSLDLNPIGCTATQGDNYCEVTVSADGNTVQLHPMSSKNMYVYTVPDNTLQKKAYERMENRFADFVDITDIIDYQKAGSYSHTAVKFATGEYGYLHTSDGTLRTLVYVRGGDMLYKLFGSGAQAADSMEFIVSTAPDKYSPAMSSTPGIRLDITYNGPTAQILYEAETGGFINWQGSSVEDLGNSVTRPADAPALYWRPDSITPQDDIIRLTALNEAGEKIAGITLAVTKDDSLFTTAAKPWEPASKAFAEAFFKKDANTMKSFLLDPEKGFHGNNQGNGLSGANPMKLKYNPDDIKVDSVSVQYEFMFDGEDSYSYLQLNMKRVNGVWKVEFYGLEK